MSGTGLKTISATTAPIPSCILYPVLDRRAFWADFCSFGRRYGLCEGCQRELREARAAADGKLIADITPLRALLDMVNAIVALNPNRPEADFMAGAAYQKVKDYPHAMASYTRAIKTQFE